jgi:hypothetical protein
MSSTVTIRQSRGVGVVGLISIIAGVLMILAGGATWWAVADKLSQEGIVVSEDASFLAGKKVNDPFSASPRLRSSTSTRSRCPTGRPTPSSSRTTPAARP